MPDDQTLLPRHGSAAFRGLRIDAYGLDLPAAEGTRGGLRAFDAVLAEWRRRLVRGGAPDPFPDTPEEVPGEVLDAALGGTAPEAAGLVQGAVEDVARNLAAVLRRYLALPEWQATQRVVVGGGFPTPRIAEIALGRAGVLLRAERVSIRVSPLRHGPSEAGLVGATRLVPPRLLAEADAVPVAELDAGLVRTGVVLPRLGVRSDMAAAGLWRSLAWRHARQRVTREQVVERLAAMVAEQAAQARAAGLDIAPVLAVAVPGLVGADGHLTRVAEGLPGDWQAEAFRAPEAIAAALARLGTPMEVLLHNAAVAQGLSDAPFQRDVARWAVLVLGPAAGNARFTNLPARG
jgi:hypothetical protein